MTTKTAKAQFLRDNLNQGETYAGLILDPAGDYHLILMAGESPSATWEQAKQFAKKHGGELPNRRELRLLWANAKDQFQPDYYWSGEQHASYSVYAWCQDFVYGNQLSSHRLSELRARLVRRLPIQ
jgi:hypothetical protein